MHDQHYAIREWVKFKFFFKSTIIITWTLAMISSKNDFGVLVKIRPIAPCIREFGPIILCAKELSPVRIYEKKHKQNNNIRTLIFFFKIDRLTSSPNLSFLSLIAIHPKRHPGIRNFFVVPLQ